MHAPACVVYTGSRRASAAAKWTTLEPTTAFTTHCCTKYGCVGEGPTWDERRFSEELSGKKDSDRAGARGGCPGDDELYAAWELKARGPRRSRSGGQDRIRQRG